MDKTTLTPAFLAQKTWDLYQTHGVPIEVSLDILESKNLKYDAKLLEALVQNHQKLSQSQTNTQFKSGVASDTAKTRAMHTATHILHQVLRQLFGENVAQKGSAITPEKARFDFSFDGKIEPENLIQITEKIQSVIDQNLEMTKAEMTEMEARNLGAIGLFGEKYGEIVTVYTLSKNDFVFSREFCGGPHITNTSQIGKFQIIKAKSIGQGLKRIEFDLISEDFVK